MNCKYCGKVINENNKFCQHCGAKQDDEKGVVSGQFTSNQYQNTTTAQGIDRKYGFKGALTSTILGIIAFILMFISIVVAVLSPVVGGLFFVGGIVLIILAAVKGVKGIKAFIYAKNTARVKPVATLVLGIVGVASAALALIFSFVAFVALIGTIAAYNAYGSFFNY